MRSERIGMSLQKFYDAVVIRLLLEIGIVFCGGMMIWGVSPNQSSSVVSGYMAMFHRSEYAQQSLEMENLAEEGMGMGALDSFLISSHDIITEGIQASYEIAQNRYGVSQIRSSCLAQYTTAWRNYELSRRNSQRMDLRIYKKLIRETFCMYFFLQKYPQTEDELEFPIASYQAFFGQENDGSPARNLGRGEAGETVSPVVCLRNVEGKLQPLRYVFFDRIVEMHPYDERFGTKDPSRAASARINISSDTLLRTNTEGVIRVLLQAENSLNWDFNTSQRVGTQGVSFCYTDDSVGVQCSAYPARLLIESGHCVFST